MVDRSRGSRRDTFETIVATTNRLSNRRLKEFARHTQDAQRKYFYVRYLAAHTWIKTCHSGYVDLISSYSRYDSQIPHAGISVGKSLISSNYLTVRKLFGVNYKRLTVNTLRKFLAAYGMSELVELTEIELDLNLESDEAKKITSNVISLSYEGLLKILKSPARHADILEGPRKPDTEMNALDNYINILIEQSILCGAYRSMFDSAVALFSDRERFFDQQVRYWRMTMADRRKADEQAKRKYLKSSVDELPRSFAANLDRQLVARTDFTALKK